MTQVKILRTYERVPTFTKQIRFRPMIDMARKMGKACIVFIQCLTFLLLCYFHFGTLLMSLFFYPEKKGAWCQFIPGEMRWQNEACQEDCIEVDRSRCLVASALVLPPFSSFCLAGTLTGLACFFSKPSVSSKLSGF